MLTLFLLAVISAMAWPQLERSFSYQRLRKAADIVRIQWCKARVEAMKTGAMRVFRYEIEGNRFRVEMLTTDLSAQQNGTTLDPASSGGQQSTPAYNADSAQNTGNAGGSASIFNGTPAGLEQILPRGIFFVSSQTGVNTIAGTTANGATTNNTTAAGDMPSSDAYVAENIASAGSGWSDPIFFYPDGTTSNAQLVLRNKEGRMMELFLRGLTGIVKVSDVTAAGGLSNP
jgi:Tfp pilus assembly protein FimT